jgi:uncharacterized membrane protein
MVLAAYNSDLYKVVLVVHILCAVVGFGAVMLNGVYGLEAKRQKGPGSLAIAEANFKVSFIGELFIYAVFPLGIALVLISDDYYTFGQTWVWLSMTVYVLALGLSHGGLIPRVKRMHALMRELGALAPPPSGTAGPGGPGGPPPQVAQLETLGRQVGVIGATLNLAVVAALVLMVFKPGA